MQMYKLLIDAGNTRIKTALMDAEGHVEPLFNTTYEDLPNESLKHTISAVWLAAVAGEVRSNIIESWLREQGEELKLHEVHSEQFAFGVQNAYSTPENLGVDRWLAMLGAYNEQQKPTVIVDAGTAITVDWVDENGKHLGGWIAPGVELMKQSVLQRAPKVFSDATQLYGRANQLGTSTPDGLLDGCVNNFAGLVRQALHVTEVELDWFDYRLIYSGGSTPLLSNDLKRRGEMRSELVLQGLALYARDA